MSAESVWRQFPATSNGQQATPCTREETIAKEGEKTIPFLRRLIDMLQENKEVISFYPGVHEQNGPTTAGRIVVHDRARVESEILPRYFNHSSFASLRRQLNYFCFSRVGKGKQRGAIYCNNQVIDLHDILRLKRRVSGSTAVPNNNSNNTTTDTKRELKREIIKDTHQQQRPSLPQKKFVIAQSTPLSKLFYPTNNKESTQSNMHADKEVSPTPRIRKKRKKSNYSIVPVVHLPSGLMRERHLNNYHITTTKKQADDCHHSAPISPETSINGNVPLKPLPSTAKPALNSSIPPSNINTNIGSSTITSKGRNGPVVNLPSTSKFLPLSIKSPPILLPKVASSAKESDVLDGCNALLSLGSQFLS